MARVAVVGPGAVGSFFAAHLSGAGHDVVACARRPFDRYVIESPEAPFEGPATVVTRPEQVTEPFDWVLVAVKAHQTPGAAAWLDRSCDAATVVVALQNGVEAVERLTPYVNGAEILASVVYCGAELVAPGHVHHETNKRLIVPEVDSAQRLADLFASTAADIDVSAHHLTSAWVKLGVNIVANGLTALTGRPIGVVAEPELAPVAARMLHETWTVGRAEGADLAVDEADATIARLGAHVAEGRTSMLADAQAGRATEHDAIHGAVLRAGRRHGIATPTVETVHAILATRLAG